MTPPRRRPVRVACKECGTLLGHLNPHRDRIETTPDAALYVEIASGGVDLVCKRCGWCRTLRGGRSFRRKSADVAVVS